MIDVKHCDGCRNDFYNGHNTLGVKECWSRKDAKLVPRLLIHINAMPPYDATQAKKIPNCYHRSQFVSVAPENLTSEGYWK